MQLRRKLNDVRATQIDTDLYTVLTYSNTYFKRKDTIVCNIDASSQAQEVISTGVSADKKRSELNTNPQNNQQHTKIREQITDLQQRDS